MQKEVREILKIRFKLVVLDYAHGTGSVTKACRDFEVPRSIFYDWKKAFDKEGKGHKLGSERITWYLERYHGIKTSVSSVYRTLVRNGMRRLPKSSPRRAIHTRRYSKEVPGHHIQVDVKFVSLRNFEGNRIRRFQYTAIDDATRIRALKIYPRHNQQNAIKFIDYVIENSPSDSIRSEQPEAMSQSRQTKFIPTLAISTFIP